MITTVPAVEIADNGNPRGRRRPNREGHAMDTAKIAHVRTELVIDAVLVALIEQVQVLFADRRQEAVRVEELTVLAIRIRGPVLVPKDVWRRGTWAR